MGPFFASVVLLAVGRQWNRADDFGCRTLCLLRMRRCSFSLFDEFLQVLGAGLSKSQNPHRAVFSASKFAHERTIHLVSIWSSKVAEGDIVPMTNSGNPVSELEKIGIVIGRSLAFLCPQNTPIKDGTVLEKAEFLSGLGIPFADAAEMLGSTAESFRVIGKLRAMSDVSGIHIVNLTGSVPSRKQLIGKLKTTGVRLDDGVTTGSRRAISANFDFAPIRLRCVLRPRGRWPILSRPFCERVGSSPIALFSRGAHSCSPRPAHIRSVGGGAQLVFY
jgi:hypothetical protein